MPPAEPAVAVTAPGFAPPESADAGTWEVERPEVEDEGASAPEPGEPDGLAGSAAEEFLDAAATEEDATAVPALEDDPAESPRSSSEAPPPKKKAMTVRARIARTVQVSQ